MRNNWLCLAMVISALLTGSCTVEPSRGEQTLEEAIGYSPDAMERLVSKRDATLRDCMARAGFDWRVDPADPALLLAPRGIFGAPTPEAERAYRLARGYGVTQIFRSLKSSNEIFAAEDSQSDRVRRLPDSAQVAYQEALLGDGNAPGCQMEALQSVGGLDLEEGGELGDAYGVALESMQTSSAYERIEEDIAACMRSRGFKHGTSDWHLIKRLVKMTGGTISGREYTIGQGGGSSEVRVRSDELAALHRDEMAQARAEVACADPHEKDVQALLRDYTRPVLEDHPDEVRGLRGQLHAVSQ
ncbi:MULTISPECIES: hypothetical protein [Aeromicrobium]|uniref:hypothetical protein n=1 Tax=Aeromicrobium TaxID=2040 RepID=UPI00257CEA4E|nr:MULTISPECIES: hypothetical protein [Aeromicrobium]